MKIPYFDAHCDTIYRCYETGEDFGGNNGHISLERLDGFSRYGQIFAFFHSADEAPPEGLLYVTNKMYDLFQDQLRKYPRRLAHCRTAADVHAAAETGKVACLLSVEGADLLECDPDRIELAQGWGVRMLNPVWNCANALSGSHCRESWRGLSDLGRAFVQTAEAADIRIDVSHLSEKGFWDLMKIAQKPVVASHSNARGVYDHSRGLTDAQFKVICETGGVVGINFYSDFVGKPATFDGLVRHIEHFLELGGETHVALGGDLDGCDALPQGMESVADVTKLWTVLERRGYSRQLLENIFWCNWLRVL